MIKWKNRPKTIWGTSPNTPCNQVGPILGPPMKSPSEHNKNNSVVKYDTPHHTHANNIAPTQQVVL
jgi:hypothetical protein